MEVTQMNLCGNTPNNATYSRDMHGGRAEEHRAEMRQIALETIQQYVPQIAAEIYNNTIERLIGAIQYDVESVVSVAVDGIGEIFNGSKLKKVISANLMNELKARLTDINIKIK